MNILRIKLTSLFIYSISLTFILLSGMIIGVYMAITHSSDVYFFILILFGLAALVFIPDLLATASTEWSITDREIKIKWLTQFFFSKKSDQSFLFQNMEEYKFQPERRFSLLRITLRDKTVFKYWHSNAATGDDFDEFLTDFKKQVSAYNEEGINFLHGIKRGKTIYETAYGIALADTLVILMIGFLILTVEFNFRNVNWIFIIPAYSSGIYFISLVISHKKKKAAANIALPHRVGDE
jgi:hypothetical protein